MTGKKKLVRLDTILDSLKNSSFHLEMKKSYCGAVAVISGVMNISEFNDESVTLLSHSGRLILSGSSMRISVLENRTVEVFGQITEVKMTYGKT